MWILLEIHLNTKTKQNPNRSLQLKTNGSRNMTKCPKVLNKPSKSPDPNSVKHPWAPMSWPQYVACWLVNLCLNVTSWEFLLLCQCSKPRSDEQVANPTAYGSNLSVRIYKVNFKFCNTLSNNMGKLFPQTKNLKNPSKFKHLPCAGDHRTFLHVQNMSCTWLRAVSAARRTVADWLLLQLITLNENRLKQTRTQDFQISTDKQHQKRDWGTPSQTITWSHFFCRCCLMHSEELLHHFYSINPEHMVQKQMAKHS